MKHVTILTAGLLLSLGAFSQAKSDTEATQAEKKENVQEVKLSPEQIEAIKTRQKEIKQQIAAYKKNQQEPATKKQAPARKEEENK